MKILVVCGGDRSKHQIALNCIKHLIKEKRDSFYFCIEDRNEQILKFLIKKKLNYKVSDVKSFLENIDNNEYDWLLNIWGTKIFTKRVLHKFKDNLNIHPSYLPFARGRDPYVWAIQNNLPVGITIHRMSDQVDFGQYYVRKKLNLNFPFTAGDIFDGCLQLSMKVFIKKWKEIRSKKIRPKKFINIKKKIYKRKDLINSNFLNLNKKKIKNI